jgi:hypothetical protein
VKTPKTVGQAITDTIKTGRRWSLNGFPGLILGTPTEFRDHCMKRVKTWKNSRQFLEYIDLEYDARFK